MFTLREKGKQIHVTSGSLVFPAGPRGDHRSPHTTGTDAPFARDTPNKRSLSVRQSLQELFLYATLFFRCIFLRIKTRNSLFFSFAQKADGKSCRLSLFFLLLSTVSQMGVAAAEIDKQCEPLNIAARVFLIVLRNSINTPRPNELSIYALLLFMFVLRCYPELRNFSCF